MNQTAWAARIRAQMDYEWQREGPPEGFPALPPIPTGRYTDPAFYALEMAHIWKKSWLLVGRDEDFAGPGSFRTTKSHRLTAAVRSSIERLKCAGSGGK